MVSNHFAIFKKIDATPAMRYERATIVDASTIMLCVLYISQKEWVWETTSLKGPQMDVRTNLASKRGFTSRTLQSHRIDTRLEESLRPKRLPVSLIVASAFVQNRIKRIERA